MRFYSMGFCRVRDEAGQKSRFQFIGASRGAGLGARRRFLSYENPAAIKERICAGESCTRLFEAGPCQSPANRAQSRIRRGSLALARGASRFPLLCGESMPFALPGESKCRAILKRACHAMIEYKNNLLITSARFDYERLGSRARRCQARTVRNAAARCAIVKRFPINRLVQRRCTR